MDGTFWILPDGKIESVNVFPYKTDVSHEEYALDNFEIDLEKAFKLKYIRVQSFVGHYLYIDHKQEKLELVQIESLNSFFACDYNNYVIETDKGRKTFSCNKKAYEFLIE